MDKSLLENDYAPQANISAETEYLTQSLLGNL